MRRITRRSVKRRRSTRLVLSTRWSSWRERITAVCASVAAWNSTTVTSAARRTFSSSPTHDAPAADDVRYASLIPSSPRISRAPRTSSRTSRRRTSASKVRKIPPLWQITTFPGHATVRRRWDYDQEVAGSTSGRALQRHNLTQFVYTFASLSGSSTIWRRCNNRDDNGSLLKRCSLLSVTLGANCKLAALSITTKRRWAQYLHVAELWEADAHWFSFRFLTTRKAAWYINSVVSVCLSVYLYVCQTTTF